MSSSAPHSSPPENGSADRTSALYDHSQRATPSPGEMIQTLWDGKWLVLGLALLAGGVAYLYWQQQPKQYRTSSVLLRDDDKQFERLDFSLPVEQSNPTGRDLYFLRHSEVFAETVARRLADSVAATTEKTNTLLRTADGDLRSIPALAARLRQAVRVQRDSRDIPALKISVTSTHPAEAALVTNTYAQAYRDHLRQSSNAQLRTSRQFLEAQKRDLKRRLRALEDTISAHVREQGRAGLLAAGDSSGGTGIVGEARQIAGEISDLRVQKEKIQLELDVERTMLDSTKARLKRIQPNLAERASSNTADRLNETQRRIASLQNRIQQIQLQNDTLTGDLRAEFENMKTRVKQLREQSRRLADRYVKEALSTDAVDPMGEGGGGGLSRVVDLQRQITEHRITITKLEARRAALDDRIETRKATLQTAPDRTLPRLKRRKQTTEELFIALSKSLQKIRVSAESTPQQAQILQRAERPTHPIGPDVRRNVMLAFLLGGMLGVGVVVVYARTDDRIEEPDDIDRLDVGLFGVVPTWVEEEKEEGDADPLGSPSREQTRPWAGIAAPCTPAAEAYRHVATNLRLGLPTALDTLLVTSPGPQEGKSTTAANLGVALSEAGQDVLLIDADPYGATLHRQFGCERAPGLTDWLAEGTEAVRTILSSQSDPVSGAGDGAPAAGSRRGGLSLLASGTDVPQPSLFLQEDHLQSLFRELRTDWDLLLLDTPPILTYDTASRLAALSDMALLVGSAGETEREAYVESVNRLDALCSGPIAGLLNRYATSSDAIYGYGYSSYASTPSDASAVEQMVQHTKRGFRRLATGR